MREFADTVIFPDAQAREEDGKRPSLSVVEKMASEVVHGTNTRPGPDTDRDVEGVLQATCETEGYSFKSFWAGNISAGGFDVVGEAPTRAGVPSKGHSDMVTVHLPKVDEAVVSATIERCSCMCSARLMIQPRHSGMLLLLSYPVGEWPSWNTSATPTTCVTAGCGS